MIKNVKAVLIDSGWVMNRPVSGHWFITPNFFSYVDKNKFKAVSPKEIYSAFNKAAEYINNQNLIISEEEEYLHFLEYYRIFSNELVQLELQDEHIKAITEDLVCNYSKYQFYKDAINIIPNLSRKYKLAVVSDAWPSLENVFIKAGLRDYFSSFVISSIKGVTKPHEAMYKTALEELEVSPDEAIFVDDSIKNCDGAKQLGIGTFVLCRDWRRFIYNKFTCKAHGIVQSLYSIERILDRTSRNL